MTTASENIDRLDAFTAAVLLAIPEGEPERLFTNDLDIAKAEYRHLAKRWHPDVNNDPRAQDVSARVNKLYAKAKDKIAEGTWVVPGLLELTDIDGHSYKVRYVKKHDFELGAFYISKGVVTYVIDKALGGDLATNGIVAIKGLTFRDDKLRKEFTGKLPEIVKHFETKDAVVCVFKKDPDMILLADLRDYLLDKNKVPLDSKHAAWIMSRLHSLACFLQLNGLTHNAISANTLFVSPPMHTAALLGGWWYAARENTALKGLPGDVIDKIPSDILATGKASRRSDLELVRAVGRDVLGDTTGSLLLRDTRVPSPMAHWLTGVSSGDAFADFQSWSQDVLKSSFGPRRFTELPVSFGDVYQPTL